MTAVIERMRAICAKCGDPVQHEYDVCCDQTVVKPCSNCMNELEKRTVKAAAEEIAKLKDDIEGYRNAIEGHRMDGFKTGYKEGFKDGYKA